MIGMRAGRSLMPEGPVRDLCLVLIRNSVCSTRVHCVQPYAFPRFFLFFSRKYDNIPVQQRDDLLCRDPDDIIHLLRLLKQLIRVKENFCTESFSGILPRVLLQPVG